MRVARDPRLLPRRGKPRARCRPAAKTRSPGRASRRRRVMAEAERQIVVPARLKQRKRALQMIPRFAYSPANNG